MDLKRSCKARQGCLCPLAVPLSVITARPAEGNKPEKDVASPEYVKRTVSDYLNDSPDRKT